MKSMRAGGTNRIDWASERVRVDLVALVTREFGPPPGRRGGGRRLWWTCPFHQDANPSFEIDPRRPHSWRCRGCGASGDAIDFVRRLNPRMSFPEAAAMALGEPAPQQAAVRPKVPSRKAPAKPSGMPEAAAMVLVEAAESRLWTDDGEDAREWLKVGRGLSEDVIRAARLGWMPETTGVHWKPPGIVLPWFNGGRLALVKVRPPDPWRERFPGDRRPPKYIEAYRNPARLACYPCPEAIQPGRALIAVEGELDCLCLSSALGDLAAVVTLGSASARPDPSVLGKMLTAFPWFVATDNDPAGDESAGGWPSCARRVKPPGTLKDWTEVRQWDIDLLRWWSEILAGKERPPLFPWEEVHKLRWGPAIGDSTPGIDIGEPFTS